jgi:DNA-directed RNA polymerase subunit K/omega
MRSEAIFRAKKMIDNKFSLCLMVSKATRQLHISPRSTGETISSVFVKVAEGSDCSVPIEAVS